MQGQINMRSNRAMCFVSLYHSIRARSHPCTDGFWAMDYDQNVPGSNGGGWVAPRYYFSILLTQVSLVAGILHFGSSYSNSQQYRPVHKLWGTGADPGILKRGGGVQGPRKGKSVGFFKSTSKRQSVWGVKPPAPWIRHWRSRLYTETGSGRLYVGGYNYLTRFQTCTVPQIISQTPPVLNATRSACVGAPIAPSMDPRALHLRLVQLYQQPGRQERPYLLCGRLPPGGRDDLSGRCTY